MDNPLAGSWNPEVDTFRLYWQFPSDLYTVEVCEVHAFLDFEGLPKITQAYNQYRRRSFKDDETVNVAPGRRCLVQPCFEEQEDAVLDAPLQSVADGNAIQDESAGPTSLRALLRDQNQKRRRCSMPFCLALPAAVAILVMHRCWSSLTVLGRWHQGSEPLFPGGPDQHWFHRTQNQTEAKTEKHFVTPSAQQFTFMASALWQSAAGLQDTPLGAEARRKLGEAASQLQAWGDEAMTFRSSHGHIKVSSF